MHPIKSFAAIALLLLWGGAAFAQGSVDDQAAVWAAVEEMWSAAESGDDEWVDTMLSGDFMGWSAESPAPRSKASTRMWARFEADQGKTLTYELYPLSIVVHGDVAVVHYLYTIAVQKRDRSTDTRNGRYTDVLVRDESAWIFLSWHGGADPD